MPVLVLGLSYKSVPVGLLERVAVPPERLPKALHDLTGRHHIGEAMVLSTCNRVEVYADVTRYHGGMADLRNFFAEWSGLAPEDFADLAYDYFEERAAAHLFAVTAGLDSMVVGERQIALQVKQAFTAASAEGSVGRVLSSLGRQALRVGKRARTETGISAGAHSMVDVALDAARHVLGPLEGRTVLIVGAGKMGGIGASLVAGTANRIMVANRTAEKGERLASKVGADLLDLAELRAGLREADLVLCSTGASAPVVEQDDVAQAMADRPDRPLVLLDIAVPRDVDPGCSIVPGVTVLDIDAIRTLTQSGQTGTHVAQARGLVQEEAERFSAWTRTVGVEPTIAALRARADEVRLAQVRRLAARLSDLDDRQRAAVEALTQGILNSLLHEPTVRLKAIADTQGGEEYAAALRELFDLDV